MSTSDGLVQQPVSWTVEGLCASEKLLDDSSLRKQRCFRTYGKNGLMGNVEKSSKMYGDGLQIASRWGLFYYGS